MMSPIFLKNKLESVHAICSDNTPIKPSMRQVLNSSKTQGSLILYLQEQIMEAYESSSTVVVISTSRGALSNQINVSHLDATREEADIIIILLGTGLKRSVADANI